MHPLDQVEEGISEVKLGVFVEHLQSREDALVCLFLVPPHQLLYLIVEFFLIVPEEVFVDKGGLELGVDVCVERLD